MGERRSDTAELRTALLRMRRATGLPVAFGGLLDERPRAPLRIGELSGTSSEVLRGLAIRPGGGLGGRAMALARPCAVTDYPEARHISHEYDEPVAAEGLRSVLAVPVVVRRHVRAVLYGALRTPQPLGDRVLDAAVAAARDMEQALVVRDEARRGADPVSGTGGVRGPGGAGGMGGGPGAWEAVREAHGELRALAPHIADPEVRDRLLAACGRLASAAGGAVPGGAPGGMPGAAPGGAPVVLAPREVDVLAAVATGATNAEAARRLGLRPETVKGYLRSAMRRLGAHTRLEAVVAARRAGLLP
ncbi:helix-turn-helix transcriptional regulator [Streptomyces fradiae]|uniref:Bacterial regulatory protein, luxR family n=4 Tax=Streptomyces TaxID=1883 RepID=A0A1Y2NR77_STRFR|nr:MULTISPECIES: helix-turn-helix transcriptional regulator [Streptomyces]KAF0649894.1 response regulator [Streptomyces fradiae ATCC 10745 = DSM 40063]OSY49547.1 Bacterial regulatory protein, luxR family [Streptomyces fradiae ATCC 10745 = DSM 40063]